MDRAITLEYERDGRRKRLRMIARFGRVSEAKTREDGSVAIDVLFAAYLPDGQPMTAETLAEAEEDLGLA